MNPTYVPALAALAGSAIGGLTSFASAWLNQERQDRATRISQDKTQRQKLYKQFIDEASKLYADALVHEQAEISALVSVYALIGRMRVLSCPAVIEQAEAVVRTIHRYLFRSEQDLPRTQPTDQQPYDGSAACLQRAVPRGSEQPSVSFNRQLDEASDEVTTTTSHPPSFVGIPADSSTFGIRVWIGAVLALAATFWLQRHRAARHGHSVDRRSIVG
jgi:hypothetical protein